jgi:hypothetical protein
VTGRKLSVVLRLRPNKDREHSVSSPILGSPRRFQSMNLPCTHRQPGIPFLQMGGSRGKSDATDLTDLRERWASFDPHKPPLRSEPAHRPSDRLGDPLRKPSEGQHFGGHFQLSAATNFLSSLVRWYFFFTDQNSYS